MSVQVEMICVCGADGKLTPLRFRMENDDSSLQTVVVSQVLVSKPITYAGIDAIQYLCKVLTDHTEHLFELRYTVKTHRWSIFRVVY